jgi:hypothetical protein
MTLNRDSESPNTANAVEEYKVACDFMRQYALLRFLYLTLLTGTTGSLVTALGSPYVQEAYLPPSIIKVGGLAMVIAFLAMELRAARFWRHMRDRAGVIALQLGFAEFPSSPRFGPASTGGASIAVYVVMATGWALSLLFGQAS